jgi:hypothetical protein
MAWRTWPEHGHWAQIAATSGHVDNRRDRVEFRRLDGTDVARESRRKMQAR